jgi:hypothetical protein
MRIVASVEIDRSASQVWAYVADYGNDINWRAGVTQMRPSQPGPAQEGVTTHELLRVLGMTFRTDATINRVEPGRRLQQACGDLGRLKHLLETSTVSGSAAEEPTT